MISLLLSLLIVGLRGARAQGRDTVVLSNLRGIGVSFELYTATYSGQYPFLKPGDRVYYEPPGGPHNSWLTTDDVWALRYLWPVTMHEVAPWEEHYATWLSPEDHPESGPFWGGGESSVQRYSSYEYSNSFVASPNVWTPGAAPTAADVQPQRSTALAFPSAKALMFERDRRPPKDRAKGDRQLVLTADGAARPRPDAEAKPAYPNPLANGRASLYHDTERGIAGRDF